MDLISRQAAKEAYCKKFCHPGVLCPDSGFCREVDEAFDPVPSAQPESYQEKLKEIADELSEKFAYLNTCLNERDIILGYLGVKRPSKIHCDTDCTNTKCECNHHYTKSPSAQPEIVRCKDCKHKYIENMVWSCPFGLPGGELFYCAYGAERRTDE